MALETTTMNISKAVGFFRESEKSKVIVSERREANLNALGGAEEWRASDTDEPGSI